MDSTRKPWQEQHMLRSYEITPDGDAAITTLGNLFQEAAVNHARQLGYGVGQLHTRGLTWVLSRMDITIGSAPQRGETLVVTTWPSARERLCVLRDFMLHDTAGNLLAQAASRWALLDIRRRRPVSPQRNGVTVPLCTDPQPIRHTFDTPIPALDLPEQTWCYTVAPGDLDLNRHANNVHYMAWALAPVPAKVQTGCRLRELRIQYQAEADEGNKIHSECQHNPADANAFCHQLRRQTDQKILAVAHSRWQPR